MDDKQGVDRIEVHGTQAVETDEPILFDPKIEKQIVRKVDIRLLPILFILLTAAFLDRINIGNARLFGLEKDLNMRGDQFNIALFVFFIPYILCETPANIVFKNLKPQVWLSCMILGFGKNTAISSLSPFSDSLENQVSSQSVKVSHKVSAVS